MSQTVVLKVAMSCGGCARSVKRVLEQLEGVESFDIDLQEKKVTVKGNVQPDIVLQTVSKTGKKSSFWQEAPEEPEPKPTEAVAEEKPAEAVKKLESEAVAEAEAKPLEAVKKPQSEAEAKPAEAVEESETKPAEAVAEPEAKSA